MPTFSPRFFARAPEAALRYRFGLVIAAASVLLAYKCLTIASLGLWPIAIGWLLETGVLISSWALFELGRAHSNKLLRGALAMLFYVGFYTLVIVSIAHTFFFESAAERRISLLEIDLRTLGFFFTNVLPLRGLLLMVGLVLAIHALAFPIARISKPAGWNPRGLGVLALWIGVATVLAVNPRPPSPIADMGIDVWEQLTTPEVTVDRKKPPVYAPKSLDHSVAKVDTGAPNFKKVLVFVMETMTSGVMARQQKLLPERAFLNREQPAARNFTRYFATNQDSRTGMLSMLGSRFIPFEAYTEEGRDHYMKLGGKSSLVDTFKTAGFKTAFAVSQQEIELVVGDYPWDQKIHFEEGDVEQQRKKNFLCFVPYQFEHSCEDRALLDRVLAFIDQKEPVFLYQEFIWGHASEYNKASGKTNTEYYSAYLEAVVEHLRSTGALEETLIVLTSDHGFRDKGLQSDRGMYHIPLLFYGSRFHARRTDTRLLSHLNFAGLLLNEVFDAEPAPQEEAFLLIIGPTGTSFLTVLTQPGQMLLMKAREGERYLLHQEGYASGPASQQAAGDFLRLFDDYLTYFSAL